MTNTLWHDDAVTVESGHKLSAYEWGVRSGLSGEGRCFNPYTLNATTNREREAREDWIRGWQEGHDYRAAEEEFGVDHELPISKFRLWPLNKLARHPALESAQ